MMYNLSQTWEKFRETELKKTNKEMDVTSLTVKTLSDEFENGKDAMDAFEKGFVNSCLKMM